MGLRFITDDTDMTAMYDSVTGWAFGPVFTSPENAERFCGWAKRNGVKDGDVRALTNAELHDLSSRYFSEGGPR